MQSAEEIILESYFPYRNMTVDERNFYINLLLHSKDINESEIRININSEISYDIVFLNLNKKEDYVEFDGAISNDSENRLINGIILKKGNKYFIKTNVYRCSDYVYGHNRDYSVCELFAFKNNKIYRKTLYSDGKPFEAEIELMNEEEIQAYLQEKANVPKLKLD